jgi:hypothetical protein
MFTFELHFNIIIFSDLFSKKGEINYHDKFIFFFILILILKQDYNSKYK